MHPRFLLIVALVFSFLSAPVLAQEQGEEEPEPLRVVITPRDKAKFDGNFSTQSGVTAPRLRQRYSCPFYDELACDVTAGFPSLRDEGRLDHVVRRVVAALVYEIQRDNFDTPDLGLVMGKKYYGLPDYVIMASLGIDPGIWEEGGLNDGVYGSLYHADTMDIGDRIGGPIILTRYTPQIERLWNQDNALGF